jgi:hypothetical protein
MPNKKQTIAQQAGYVRGALKRKGMKHLQDFNGRKVPIDYVPDLDLVKHHLCTGFFEKIEQKERELRELKTELQQAGDELHTQLLAEGDIRDDSVGGFTLARFDKQARIIYKMGTVKDKNPEQLQMAGQLWNKFMEDEYPNTDPKQHFLHSIVNELVFNAKDEVDTNLINTMNKYAERVKNKYYHKFLHHLNKAYDLRHTKRFEIFEKKDDQGKYKSVILTYAKLDPLEESGQQ